MDTQFSDILSALIEERFEAETAFLAALVRQPSDNPPGDCDPHADVTAGLLEGLGFEVERHPVPADLIAENGMISATNLVVRQRFGSGGPVVALNAHGDVVPPGDGWTKDPYGAEIEDGWMYGRGVAVSKSDIATYAFAMAALQQAQPPLNGTVELHVTYDEESGGAIGPEYLLAQDISKPDFVVCAGFSHSVVTAHNGCLHLEVEVLGRSAHAAQPDSGHDALVAATAILNALYAHREAYGAVTSKVEGIGSPSLVVGLIEGGVNTNVVPDRVRFRLDRRMIPEEDPQSVESALRQVIADAVASGDHGAGIEVRVRRILLALPFGPVPGADRLAEIVCARASEVLGEAVPALGVPLYADARHYAAAGVPTVMYGAGPRTLLEANAHRADERVPLDRLLAATKVVALSLADLLG